MQFLAIGSLLTVAKAGLDVISNKLLNKAVGMGIGFMGSFQNDETSIPKSIYLCRRSITLTDRHAILWRSLKVKAQLRLLWGSLCLSPMHGLARAVLF